MKRNQVTYSIKKATINDHCDECGQPALILLVADSHDETGYIDEIALCDEHSILNEVNEGEMR